LVEAIGPWHNVVVLTDCSFKPTPTQQPSYYDLLLGTHDPENSDYKQLSANLIKSGLDWVSVMPEALREGA